MCIIIIIFFNFTHCVLLNLLLGLLEEDYSGRFDAVWWRKQAASPRLDLSVRAVADVVG